MPDTVYSFCRDEDGAITIDWVVLTAALLGVTYLASSLISTGTMSLRDEISIAIENHTVGGNF
jgi:Flp pilus assembly pilin Flp